ncbi:MAG: GNAT family N-acetyltransferase [Evtepia gabavorous]
MDHAKELAKARGCKALVLDSGMPRTQAHRFYEIYGFEKAATALTIIWSRKRGNLPRKNRHLPPGRCRFFGVPYRVFPDVPLQKKKSL